MPLTPEEAAQALDEIDRTQHHSRELRGYEGAAPYFLVWGLVWAFGYGLTDYAPDYRNAFWGAGILIGAVASILLGHRQTSARSTGKSKFDWRHFAISAGLAAFFGVTSSVLSLEPRQIDAFIPLVFAGIYLFAGIWTGIRISLAGVALATGVVVGYFNAGPHFSLWMAIVGGGVLILTSIWLRRA